MATTKDFDIIINMGENQEFKHPQRTGLAAVRYSLRTYLAEFLGSLILVMFGDGVIAQVSFNKGAVGSSFLSINIGWAIGLAMAVMISVPISGAHLNPAVTLAFALFRKFEWKKAPGYIISQLLGSFVGAVIVYVLYYPAINDFDGGLRQTVGEFGTAGIFTTFPYQNAPIYHSFIAEWICTAVLVLMVLAVTDKRHQIPNYMAALSIGGSVLAIGISIGFMSSYSMNPARDIAPRLFLAMAGWGWAPFTAANYYFWVPIVAPCFGAISGVLVYDALIDPPSDE